MVYNIAVHESFDFHSAEYEHLFAESKATAFQSPIWLTHIYADLVDQLGADPLIISARCKKSDELKLVLPMVRRRYNGLAVIEPADFGICDYNAVVAAPGVRRAFFEDQGLQSKIGSVLKPYQLIFFRKMPEECSFLMTAFDQPKVGEMDTCTYDTEIWGPFEEWQQQALSSSFRKELRRKRRKLEQHGEVRFEILSDADEIRQAIELLSEMRSQRFDDDLLKQQIYRTFYANVAVEGAKTGECQTALLYAGNDITAVEFGLVHDNCYHFLLGGFDGQRFSKSSPGMLMIEHVLRERIQQGDSRADFTIGDEAYKAKFNATPRPLKHVAVSGGFLGQLAHLAYENGGLLKKAAKTLANYKVAG
ncbi:GNAT family N-acetyltransferase [Cohaesibacter gelatinilyticus]|uniref:Acetyltransferase involved in cellulose biosynthesis, CelD/BcsL family n=1 Tax=Cohaesibacter gelatinilyticus TaxID=372072 RepID=A0A285NCC7_9HYPH|nr:GNAT family N-acetyltransferase [Cohaesibacter gelatinilyticus]SNZ07069.1 Acetyltransferase involved in cellulose biosynthesis, CelD/BcsL family [Cohaesibacter gelatinilyticus]HAT85215.1 GNAT family N-acetyltransferase [Hyphomicrobiales bacterium]